MATEPLGVLRARLRQDALNRGMNPRDVDLLLSDYLSKSLPWMIAHGDEMIDASQVESLLDRRHRGEPLQYIRGHTEFFSREFVVDDRVLIPRPETEVLVEAAIERAARGARVVDIGTGSGCIAISIERSRPDLHVTAVDVSIGALAVADLNRRRLQSNVRLAASHLLDAVPARFDMIVSNPPYIPEADVATLATEVRDYEPHLALTPGPKGTEIIERILDSACDADVLLEIGYGQEAQMRELAKSRAYRGIRFLNDLAGIPRVVVLSRHAE